MGLLSEQGICQIHLHGLISVIFFLFVYSRSDPFQVLEIHFLPNLVEVNFFHPEKF